jgi:hypothetical protein
MERVAERRVAERPFLWQKPTPATALRPAPRVLLVHHAPRRTQNTARCTGATATHVVARNVYRHLGIQGLVVGRRE